MLACAKISKNVTFFFLVKKIYRDLLPCGTQRIESNRLDLVCATYSFKYMYRNLEVEVIVAFE